ncbi:hypothetical protein GCM10009700_35070 [Brevibacterium sanguinis]|uniref:hypothetical protein n=1 Tax=Brevibacterium sanguinis TaxID=232444 RepID=UPI0031DD4EC3
MKKSTTYLIDGILLSDLIDSLEEIRAEQGSDLVIAGVEFSLDRRPFDYYESRFTITLVDDLEDWI